MTILVPHDFTTLHFQGGIISKDLMEYGLRNPVGMIVDSSQDNLPLLEFGVA